MEQLIPPVYVWVDATECHAAGRRSDVAIPPAVRERAVRDRYLSEPSGVVPRGLGRSHRSAGSGADNRRRRVGQRIVIAVSSSIAVISTVAPCARAI